MQRPSFRVLALYAAAYSICHGIGGGLAPSVGGTGKNNLENQILE